jgi:hypothetical protein
MRYYRKPRTRQVHADNAKNNPFARAKRRNIPDEFEDLLRSDVLSKSWKNIKRTKQWG